ncbi:HAD-IIIC family phosphatase [Asticcacaulis sp. EMRT-3]|uniref:HAD-IIIC family phosphatase n=1 Tax=Asticcacaulis sp. EMRT-3 TaxID=3040349 RepID=UPI0024AFED63|nr:HAD-IIIC family phosphatase [Asticcacaulis sp. EMRT-3]MDI7776354.1 HAD-IIIC family phosphatase [Asticcacaulis sp. EMRT-3]
MFGRSVAAPSDVSADKIFSEENQTEDLMLVKFGSGENSDDYTLAGWSHSESTFRWSLEGKSVLSLPVVFNAWIRAELDVFSLPDMRQPLYIHMDGREIARFEIEGRQTVYFDVPPARTGRMMQLEFIHPVFRTDFSQTEDVRPLALAFSTLRLMGSRSAIDEIASATLKDIQAEYGQNTGANYLAPSSLEVTPTPLKRIALIGSCYMNAWAFQQSNLDGCHADFFTVNNGAPLPDISEADIKAYDLQIIQMPLRSLIDYGLYSRGSWDNAQDAEDCFRQACDRLALLVDTYMDWNVRFGTLTFVANYYLPEMNPMGRLFPRFDFRNPEYLVSRLNEFLENYISKFNNCYIFDIDRVMASIGRRYIQGDKVEMTWLGQVLPAQDLAGEQRMETAPALMGHYEYEALPLMRGALWRELVAMYRTVRQVDTVKLVVVDLDDTLWRGVSGDMTDVHGGIVEGWPLGVVEALLFLKKRGVLLAIISKNEESRIREIWHQIFYGLLTLEDFAAVRINWRPKAENMQEILQDINLLPRSVVFLDDNPVERAAMSRLFPDMRIFGRYPYYFRRMLLWSAETQSASVTAESGRRTEMVQAQLHREEQRKGLSREEFLMQAAPRVTLSQVGSAEDARFSRCLELINKTNQFNTTGRRWNLEEINTFFAQGGRLYVFDVVDKFTSYGLVGVVMVKPSEIVQWVMSCRILGYQIEDAVMRTLLNDLFEGGAVSVSGTLKDTDVNYPCRDLFSKTGFEKVADTLFSIGPDQNRPMPPHIDLTRA